METVINEIYEHNHNYLSRWRTGLANHVSMAAAAMYLMQDDTHVSDQKIREDADLWTKNLSPKRMNAGGVKLNDLPWSIQQALLGHDDFMESWQSYFNQQCRESVDETLRLWLPRLAYGLSAAAGHSIIRIHYALAVKNALASSVFIEEMAISFADLASRHLCLTSANAVIGNNALESFLSNHSGLPASARRTVNSGSLIEDRLIILRTQPDFQNQTQSIALDYDFGNCLRLLSAIATQTTNFALLHAITVGQAVLDILNCYPDLDGQPIRQGYRDFVVATVLGEDLPNAQGIESESIPLSDIYARVPDLIDDHSQKISYSLSRLYKEFGYDEFLNAAGKFQSAYG